MHDYDIMFLIVLVIINTILIKKYLSLRSLLETEKSLTPFFYLRTMDIKPSLEDCGEITVDVNNENVYESIIYTKELIGKLENNDYHNPRRFKRYNVETKDWVDDINFIPVLVETYIELLEKANESKSDKDILQAVVNQMELINGLLSKIEFFLLRKNVKK